MYVSVDVDGEEGVEGFKYVNREGQDEFVSYFKYTDDVEISVPEGTAPIYYDDIPKLIKALQAAYDYKRGAELE